MLKPQNNKPLVFPFGSSLRARDPVEHMQEEAYKTIAALNQMSGSVLAISNKLSQDARSALFFDVNADEDLRELKVSLAMQKRHEIETARPDPGFLAEQKPVPSSAFASAENDAWLGPKP
jgi:hypothetical protein